MVNIPYKDVCCTLDLSSYSDLASSLSLPIFFSMHLENPNFFRNLHFIYKLLYRLYQPKPSEEKKIKIKDHL